uniref:Uncharacterized protein n=1 Tax=Biomphalaria glabrata TaxID=6526 RepID=A0A2C9KZF2_BIOGL
MKQRFELFHPTTERLDDFLQNNLKPLDAALWDNNLKPLNAALWDNNLKPLNAALWDNNLKPLNAALWNVLRPLLLLSHGQATVQRGFSCNKEVIIDNMHQQTLVAQRRICDFLKINGGVLKVAINKTITNSCCLWTSELSTIFRKRKKPNQLRRPNI